MTLLGNCQDVEDIRKDYEMTLGVEKEKFAMLSLKYDDCLNE